MINGTIMTLKKKKAHPRKWPNQEWMERDKRH